MKKFNKNFLLVLISLLISTDLFSQFLFQFGIESLKLKMAINQNFPNPAKKLEPVGIVSLGIGLKTKFKNSTFAITINNGKNPNEKTFKVNSVFTEIYLIHLTRKKFEIGFFTGIRIQNLNRISIPGYPSKAELVYPKQITIYQPFLGPVVKIEEFTLALSLSYNFYSRKKIWKFSNDVIPLYKSIEFPDYSLKLSLLLFK